MAYQHLFHAAGMWVYFTHIYAQDQQISPSQRPHLVVTNFSRSHINDMIQIYIYMYILTSTNYESMSLSMTVKHMCHEIP